MLIVLRVTTFLFVTLFLLANIDYTLMVVGTGFSGLAADTSEVKTFTDGYEAGRIRGAKFAEKWRRTIDFLSLAISVLIAGPLSLSGYFPWCRIKVSTNKVPLEASASEVVEYYLAIDGETKGPFSGSFIGQQIREGGFPQSGFYWKTGMTEWRPLEDFVKT